MWLVNEDVTEEEREKKEKPIIYYFDINNNNGLLKEKQTGAIKSRFNKFKSMFSF